MSALDRLKSIQSNFKRNWNGISCEHSGRPGTSNLLNKKRTFNISENVGHEEERQRTILKIFGKLKDFEEEKLSSSGNSTTSFNKSNQGFFPQASQSQSQFYNANQQRNNYADFINFKNIKEN